MLVGKCKKCGEVYIGWALANPEQKRCNCGSDLIISDESSASILHDQEVVSIEDYKDAVTTNVFGRKYQNEKDLSADCIW